MKLTNWVGQGSFNNMVNGQVQGAVWGDATHSSTSLTLHWNKNCLEALRRFEHFGSGHRKALGLDIASHLSITLSITLEDLARMTSGGSTSFIWQIKCSLYVLSESFIY